MATRSDFRERIGPGGGMLRSPERNRYYFGKLLDAFHLDLEQRYSSGKRELLNRLSVGSGVLCGLQVRPTVDRTRLIVTAGVALDGLGREIIVPADTPTVDPRQPTDECGRPQGEPLMRGGVVTVYLCYHECPRDPAPVMVDSCGPDERCEFGVVEERYRVQVRPGSAAPTRDLIDDRQCARIFGQKPSQSLTRLEAVRGHMAAGDWADFFDGVNGLRMRAGREIIVDPGDLAGRAKIFEAERERVLRGSSRRSILCDLFGGICPTPQEPCVPLATVRIDPRGRILSVDNCTVRRTLYSNAFLLDLILCLAERIDACCAEPTVKSLSIVSGDQQVGVAEELLSEPLVVSVSEAGAVVANELVIFEALGDGSVGADATSLGPTFATTTMVDGTAELPAWRLGTSQGLHTATARIAAGAPMLVTFRATARVVKPDLPVVRAVWPPNTTTLSPSGGLAAEWLQHFARRPRLQLTFDRRMAEAQLADPDTWLGLFALRGTRDGIGVVRVPVTRLLPPEPGILGEAGITETFLLMHKGAAELETTGTVMRRMVQPMVSFTTMMDAVPAADPAPDEPPPSDIGITVVYPALRYLLVIRAGGDNINAADPPGLLLDADFGGTTLESEMLEKLRNLAPGQSEPFPATLWDALDPAHNPELPESGNGQAGGWFHSWFEIVAR